MATEVNKARQNEHYDIKETKKETGCNGNSYLQMRGMMPHYTGIMPATAATVAVGLTTQERKR